MAAYELGTRRADTDTIERLARALGVDAPSLIDVAPARGLRVRAVADLLDTSPDTVYRLIKAGDLSAYRVGGTLRVPAEDVARLQQQRLPIAAAS